MFSNTNMYLKYKLFYLSLLSTYYVHKEVAKGMKYPKISVP